jgi:hypothetical protein
MSDSLTLHAQLQLHPASKLHIGLPSIGQIIAALSTGTLNNATGIEHRGLAATDRRYALASNTTFIKGVPTAPIWQIISDHKSAAIAVNGRKYAKTKITVKQYIHDLVVRSLRGQILNPILRTERWLMIGKIAERLRSVALGGNSRFMKMALNPINLNYFMNWLHHG